VVALPLNVVMYNAAVFNRWQYVQYVIGPYVGSQLSLEYPTDLDERPSSFRYDHS
jgi:hypothetical protein